MQTNDIADIAEKRTQAQQALSCRIFTCASTGCVSSGSDDIIDALRETITAHGLDERVEVVPTGCMGLCARGPLVRVEIKGHAPVLYGEIGPLIARLIVDEHVVPCLEPHTDTGKDRSPPGGKGSHEEKQGRGTNEEAADAGPTGTVPHFLRRWVIPLDLPFFSQQHRVVLGNAGIIDPESIDAYIAADGYRATLRALNEMRPDDIIAEMRTADLRGRGGAGFPVARKWGFARQYRGDEKFIICNGDEGDPGAYMDRSILEADPHRVLEGMIIAAYTTGATYGWFYIRAEYPLAIARVKKAIQQARKYGFLGRNILGTSFCFDCDVRLGAGAFVCGEETALIASIEGKRGTPRPRPPYPSEKGLWEQPSCVNNVESLANVAPILRNGGAWFASIGTAESKGTKVFAVTGKIKDSGLIEVPMGTSLHTIIQDICGGSDSGRAIKAVQTGGPSGGVIPAHMLQLPVSYEHFREASAIMGSGGMIVLDEDDSMVDIAAFYVTFTRDESCGKCAPCRIGGQQLLTLLQKIADGKGTHDDIDTIRRICASMKQASLCGLGQTAPNPVITSLDYFPHEYEEKLMDTKTPHAEETHA
jgi:NADH:ubiquinone oxidoreductase subunit F (NADH-binding)/(2Fe-2S) ferredoxin